MRNNQDTFNNYLNKCDLLNKFYIENIHQFPVLKKISFEYSNLVFNSKSSLKQDFIKFYVLLIFYILTQKLPYLFLKKSKKLLNFKINYLDKQALSLIETSFNFEKTNIIKKKLTNLNLKNKCLLKLSLDLIFRNFYLNSEIVNIFGELTPLNVENIRLSLYLQVDKKKFSLKNVILQESLFYNYNSLWVYNK